MTPFYPIFEALANALAQLITMISKINIMEVNPQKLAMLGQLVADSGRVVIDLARIIISILEALKT